MLPGRALRTAQPSIFHEAKKIADETVVGTLDLAVITGSDGAFSDPGSFG